jgi:hypothetical protein
MKLYLPGTDLWSWCRREQAAWPEDEDDVLVSIIVQQLCDGVGTARMPASAQKRRFGCSLGVQIARACQPQEPCQNVQLCKRMNVVLLLRCPAKIGVCVGETACTESAVGPSSHT